MYSFLFSVAEGLELNAARFESDYIITSLPFTCNFGDLDPNQCNMTNDRASKLEWQFNRGRTPTDDTGPISDHEVHGNATVLYLTISLL